MNNAQMLAALAELPDADMLTATNIDDPLGSGTYYRADTVVQLLSKERETCERLRSALSDLLRQIEGCDGTAQLSIDLAEAALKTPNAQVQAGPAGVMAGIAPATEC